MFPDNNQLSIGGSRALAERMAPQMRLNRESSTDVPVASVPGPRIVAPAMQ
jgi:hypothetical protein